MSTFVIQLVFKNGEWRHLGPVYGPYKNQKAAEEAIKEKWPNDDHEKEKFLMFDGELFEYEP